ncbi:MAG: N-acetyl-gamma-glutamyl-phosphate reductase [Nevskiaceae bacterium]|nr:MAG: N-acetyl-gamma-glutamyl-phosphate reductase [Nevskiaceae bacterium]
MIKVGIVGGTGYTGAELLRILSQHSQVEVRILTSRQEAGRRADALYPSLRGHTDLSYSVPDVAALKACDAVFFATPHGTAMQMAPDLVAAGVKVIDLSADFRLQDKAQFTRWYKLEHSAPDLLKESVYGLPEIHRARIRKARVIGNPGCHATATQLALLPLLAAGVIETDGIIADSKTGISGAGRELKLGSMYSETADMLKAYGVAGHRHQAEIDQELGAVAGGPVSVTFVPHLTPMIRGIHVTAYARLKDRAADLQALFEARYHDEPFVDVMPAGEHPETRSVRGANVCRIAVHKAPDGKTAVVLSVIDNLVKGASGQAVQCMNLMFGLEETLGLQAPPLMP